MEEECKDCGYGMSSCICGKTDRDLLINIYDKVFKIMGFVRANNTYHKKEEHKCQK